MTPDTLQFFPAQTALDGDISHGEPTTHVIQENYVAPNPDGQVMRYLVFTDGSYVVFPEPTRPN